MSASDDASSEGSAADYFGLCRLTPDGMSHIVGLSWSLLSYEPSWRASAFFSSFFLKM